MKKIYSKLLIIFISIIFFLIAYNNFNSKFNFSEKSMIFEEGIDSNLFSEKLDLSSSLKVNYGENSLYSGFNQYSMVCHNKEQTINLIYGDILTYIYCGNYFNITNRHKSSTYGILELGPFYNGVVSQEQCLEEMSDNCYFVLAMQENDVNYCESINLDYLKEKCYYVSAEKNNDLSKCELIDGNYGFYQDYRISCYETLIYRNLQKNILTTEFCWKINNPFSKDNCYYSLSKINNNIEICNLIESSGRKNICIDSLIN